MLWLEDTVCGGLFLVVLCLGLQRHGEVPTSSPQDEEVKICLIPELCSMTGLTDQAREDFRVMKVRLHHYLLSTPSLSLISLLLLFLTNHE